MYRNKDKEVYQTNKLWVDSLKSGMGCSHCGENNPSVLLFHHKDPKSKVRDVSSMLLSSRDIIWSEIQKCIVVCKPCHQNIHRIRRPVY